MNELYDLEKDIGESNNLFNENKNLVNQLLSYIDSFRKELGDKSLSIVGNEVRPPGKKNNPK